MRLFTLIIAAVVACTGASADQKPLKKSNFAIISDMAAKSAKTSPQSAALYAAALYHEGYVQKCAEFCKGLETKMLTKDLQLVNIRCLAELGKHKDALVVLKTLRKPEEPDLELDFLRAKCLVGTKEYKEARKLLTLILKVRPQHAGAHYYYALTCAPEQTWDEAVMHCRTVLILEDRGSRLARNASAIMLAALFKKQTQKK